MSCELKNLTRNSQLATQPPLAQTLRRGLLSVGVGALGGPYTRGMSQADRGHVPVLLEQAMSLLDLHPGAGAGAGGVAGGVAVDCTLGRGGHAEAMVQHLGAGGTLIGLDVDAGNIAAAEVRLRPVAEAAGVTLHVRHANFRELPSVLRDLDLTGADAVLADLGFASNQMDDPARGFSFNEPGPLDMRLDPSLATTAADLVNTLPQRELSDLLYQYGDERLSRPLARLIVQARDEEPIRDTARLATLARRVYGRKGIREGIHPATRTFMALRIAVNDELGALDDLLHHLPDLLNPGGRAAIISFHSLEDRRVKRAMLAWQQAGLGERLTRKPVTADDVEREANPRSRSAKMRAFLRHRSDS